MTIKNRLKVLINFTNFHIFALIAIVYGAFFGGIFSIGDITSGEATVKETLATSFTTGGLYFSFFSVAMIIIFVTMNTKLFKSFSVSEKIIRTMWHDLIGIVTIVNTLILTLVLLIARGEAEYGVRLFNLDYINGGFLVMLTLSGIIALATMLCIQLMALISNIGNHHGLLYALGSGILLLSIAMYIGIDFVTTIIIWGEYVMPTILGATILTIILYFINKRMLRNIEVGR